jgi:hypothetical protein
MELLVTILLVGLIVAWMTILNLRARVGVLERQLGPIEAGSAAPVAEAPAQMVAPEPEAAPPAPPAQPERRPPQPEELVITLEPEPETQGETLGALFERLVGGRLLIWLGGIALVVAAIYLIRYSIEIGLMTPETRMIGAAAFGLLLLGLGEYARKGRLLADDQRIAQALVGAGIAVLYATAYGSHILYGLIDTAAASSAMLAVTALALGLSLRHGAPTAVMGLVGGFVTPLLVGDPESSAVPLLAYLGLLDLAIFLVAWRRGWTWLATGAVALSFVWSIYLLAQPPQDALASGVFILVLAVAASLVRPGEGRSLGLIQPILIGIVQLTLLVTRTDLDLPAWSLFAALSAASMILAAMRAEYRLGPPIALSFALLLLFGKSMTKLSPFVPEAAIGITFLFGIGGLALAFWRPALLWSAIGAIGLAGPALILRGLRPELLPIAGWGALLSLLALGPALLVWRDRGRASAAAPADLTLLMGGAAAALLAGAAVWDLLPHELAAAGWVAVAIAIGLAARRLGDLALTMVAAATAIVDGARALHRLDDRPGRRSGPCRRPADGPDRLARACPSGAAAHRPAPRAPGAAARRAADAAAGRRNPRRRGALCLVQAGIWPARRRGLHRARFCRADDPDPDPVRRRLAARLRPAAPARGRAGPGADRRDRADRGRGGAADLVRHVRPQPGLGRAMGRHPAFAQPDPSRLPAERDLALRRPPPRRRGEPLRLLARRLACRLDRRRDAARPPGLPRPDPDRAGRADRRILRLFARRLAALDRVADRRRPPAR